MRHWFQPGVASISALAHNSTHGMLTSTPEQRTGGYGGSGGLATGTTIPYEEDDPTYGMAAYAHHKSMVEKLTQEQELANQHQRTGGKSSDWLSAAVAAPDTPNGEQQQQQQRSAAKRKRVQFSVYESGRDHRELRAAQLEQPYPFAMPLGQQNLNQETPTLRSRIAGFFARLF